MTAPPPWPVLRSRRHDAAPQTQAPVVNGREHSLAPVAPVAPALIARRRWTTSPLPTPTTGTGATTPLPPATDPSPTTQTPLEGTAIGRRARPATPLAPHAVAPLVPMPDKPGLATVAPARPHAPAGSAITHAAESRIAWLKGQVRNDCAALVNIANHTANRIGHGDIPRQEGEFIRIAHRMDQSCASLYELMHLLKY